MTLFEKVKNELENVTQDQVSQLLIDLNLSEDQILADDTLVLNFITRLSKLQGNLTTNSETKLKPKPTMNKTDSNIQPIQPTNGGLSVKPPIKLKAKSVIDNAQNTLQDLTVGIERIENKIADTIYDRLTEVPNNVN